MLKTDKMDAPDAPEVLEVPEAIIHLRNLHLFAASPKLMQYLAAFKKPNGNTSAAFTTGVREFTRVANLDTAGRIDLFGNKFYGLHYTNDLAKLWNDSSSENILAHQLNSLCPSEWNRTLKNGDHSLVYRGDMPAEALDKLLQGPAVIDCGMFCQLCIWFGIRYMLGDAKFNEVFGRSPFYITQFNFEDIVDPTKPYLGSPLFSFFTRVRVSEAAIGIANIPNHSLYTLKHVGGHDDGENCIKIGETYTIFAPSFAKASGLQRRDVEELLLKAFNLPQDVNDANVIAVYAKEPEKVNPRWGRTNQTIINMSKTLASFQLSKYEWKPANSDGTNDNRELYFDLEKFNGWVKKINENILQANYVPLHDHQLRVPDSLREQIPFENRYSMTFSTFRAETTLQQEMRALALHFCQSVMNGKSCSITLTGKAGIGKTASAVSCAKELVSRSKKIIWISEVTMQGWMDKAESLTELSACKDKVKLLLQDNPDAVFLDDDNLAGYAGIVLLEEIHTWYVCNPGKGLFITSNETITFKHCYGFKIDGQFHYPPFLGYDSAAYQNIIIRRNLMGQSLRSVPEPSIKGLTDDMKLQMLHASRVEQSLGVIIDHRAFDSSKYNDESIEFIPGIDEELLVPIRQSLKETRGLGPSYNNLTEHQKRWLRQHRTGGHYLRTETGTRYEKHYQTIIVRPFEGTRCQVIAIELIDVTTLFKQKEIGMVSLDQLLRVVNYAHDSGGKRVIVINRTCFSQEELIEKIKSQIPASEKERTVARLDNLLLSPSLMLSLPAEKKSLGNFRV